MKAILPALVAAVLGAWTVAATAADDPILDRNAAKKFAALPDGVRFPEGIAANPTNGDVFVATFDFGPNQNKLLRFARSGRLVASRDMAGPMLGLAFDAAAGKVYVANFGSGTIQRIAANFDATTPLEDVATVPTVGAPADRLVGNPDGSSDGISFGFSGGARAPNAMVFDSVGNLYISDSFQGAIFRIDGAAGCAAPCGMAMVVHDPLLATAGFPPFGANGVALNSDESVLFVANTGDDTVLRVNLGSGEVTEFAQSVNGADGIVFDAAGRLWVAANQADEVVALDANGRVIARLGEFKGMRGDGSPEGLLFPASLAIVGNDMYVTNLALPLTPPAGDEWEENVTRWTVSRIRVPNR